jgi:transcription initiation factor TFIIIB Brf1 subunit/transcription initiation factor TFIIB
MLVPTSSSLLKSSLFLFIKSKLLSKLNINAELTKLCHFIALKIEKNNYMADNTPHSIAAGIVYFVIQICSLNVNRYEVKNVSEISEVTINKCFKKLNAIRESLLPSVILEKYS